MTHITKNRGYPLTPKRKNTILIFISFIFSFINFAYQGIPEDLPIETFEIRPAIKEKEIEQEQEEKDADDLVDIGEQEVEEIPKVVVKNKR